VATISTGQASPAPASAVSDQEFHRIVRIVAAGAHPDVARAAEQRGGARLVAQQDRIALEVGAGQLHPLARDRAAWRWYGGGIAGAGLVRAAEEEDPHCAPRAGKPREILLRRLHWPVGGARQREPGDDPVGDLGRGSPAPSARPRWWHIRN
jgi:hypothetical protein